MSTTPRHRLSLFIAALVVMSAFAPVPPAMALEPVTSVDPVGDFEYPGTPVQGWAVNATAPNSVVASGSRSISGSRSMRIQDVSETASAVATRPKFTVIQGSEYRVQAYAFITSGSQTLAVNFYDATGARVYRVSTTAIPTGGGWTRLALRAMPPKNATAANIQISSASTTVSEGWWDSIAMLRPILANAGFEEGAAGADIPAWRANVAGARSSIVTTNEEARTGRRSVKIIDDDTSGATTLRSSLTPVFPGVAADARFWMLLRQGQVTLTIRWYDANRREIGQEPFTTNIPTDRWQLVVRTAVAPQNAHYALIQYSTRSADRATAYIDGITLAPAVGTLSTLAKVTGLGEPLDGFSNTQSSGMVSVGGKPKMYTVVSGYPAHFEVVDVESGALEADIAFENENFNQSSAMTTGQDGNVYIGTQGGELIRWRPGASTLDDLGRVTPTATSVFDLETGPDGRIWGGTYPGGELFSYTPGASVTNHGQVAPGRSYARSIAVDARHVYVGVGSTDPAIIRVDANAPANRTEIALPESVTSGQILELEAHGRFLAASLPSGVTATGTSVAGQRYLYDLHKATWDVPANVPGQAPVGMDTDGRFFYLAANHLNAVDQSGAYTPLVRTDLSAGRNRMMYHGTLGGVSGEWLVAHTPAEGIEAIDVVTFRRIKFDFMSIRSSERHRNCG